MGGDDSFWASLLAHLRDQVLVPVVGPEICLVNVDGAETTLTAAIGQRLVDRYHLTVAAPVTDMGLAVEAFLREHGREEAEQLYLVIYELIRELNPVPGAALRDLAAIHDLRLFVSTTPDRLLAQALNEVRFQGRPGTQEIICAGNRSTRDQDRNAVEADPTETVVLSLFGRAASISQFAIHEEDQLEWLHALISDTAGLPDWLSYRLKNQPLLFIGCDIPDWLGRFLLRFESSTRLYSLQSNQFFLVQSPGESSASLSQFIATYCPKTRVQQLQMEPAGFVAELYARWKSTHPDQPDEQTPVLPPPAPDQVFISYMHEDAAAAKKLSEVITEKFGANVWFDENDLHPGDDWENKILNAIREQVRLFIPLVSTHTEKAEESYVFKEWDEAIDRSRSIPRRRFIVPVIVDQDYAGDASRYQLPDAFTKRQIGWAPGGDPDPDLLATLTEEIRNLRRPGAPA